MQVVQSASSSNGLVGEVISSNHHGVNMLFHADRVDADSDFRAVIETLGATVVRYPGGTIAEEYFNLADPNASTAYNVIDQMHHVNEVRTREITTLREYLDYVAEIEGRAVIALPTYRFFEIETGQLVAGAETEIKTFIRDLMSGDFGPVSDVTLEIGNEFYQSRFQWTDAEFASLQGQIAEWIDDEATALGVRNDVTLLAQAGRNDGENALLSSQFTGADAPNIDGVVTHFYGTNSNGNTMGIGGGIGRRLEDINDIWSGVLGPDFELAVTEWNVGESGEATTLINGIMRSAPLLRIYAELAEHGVDTATIWSTQTAGPAGLSQTEGTGSDLSPTGYFFEMIGNATEGKRLVDPKGNFKLENSSGDDIGYRYTFEDATSSVTYFASGTDEVIDLSANMSRYYASDAYVYLTVLTAAPGTTGTDYWAEASLEHITKVPMIGSGASWTFDFTLQPYDMVELHIVHGTGVTIRGDAQNAINDDLDGTVYDDLLFGELGNDRLEGRFGNDTIYGGAGNDKVIGGKSDDTLYGDEGNDKLYGGEQNDLLFGGTGDDLLRGNRNNDTLYGGEGTDHLYGGGNEDLLFGGAAKDYLMGENGRDTLDGGTGDDNLRGGELSDTFVYRNESYGYDRIMDFEVGIDKIDLTDFGFSSYTDVQAISSDITWGIRIDFGNRNVLLVENMTLDQLSQNDFLL